MRHDGAPPSHKECAQISRTNRGYTNCFRAPRFRFCEPASGAGVNPVSSPEGDEICADHAYAPTPRGGLLPEPCIRRAAGTRRGGKRQL